MLSVIHLSIKSNMTVEMMASRAATVVEQSDGTFDSIAAVE